MENRKALVFDTNFIIENKKNFDEVIKKLKSEFTVYVTQVSIDERVAQKQREAKSSFDEIEKCAKNHRSIAEIKMLKTFEEQCDYIKSSTTKAYYFMAGDNVIPYDKDEQTFSVVLDRALKKIPPFPLNDKSDNGFKDTVLWLSLINYFKNNGEDEVVFVSEDKAFGKNQDSLMDEFKRETSKSIKIVPNSFYSDLFKQEDKRTVDEKCVELPDVSQLRDRINDVIYDLCGFEVVDSWGIEYWERRFSISRAVDGAYMKVVFSSLYNDIKEHIFDKSVSPEKIFDLDDRFFNVSNSIPMSKIESAFRLHEEIKKEYPDYLEQFYITAACIFNSNYIEPKADCNEDLPF